MLDRGPGAGHQALEEMELVRAQPIVLAMPFINFLASYLPPLSFSLFICKMGSIISPSS